MLALAHVDAASRCSWLLFACVLCGTACGAHDTDGEPEQQEHGGTGGMPSPNTVGSGTGGASGSGGATSSSDMSVEPSATADASMPDAVELMPRLDGDVIVVDVASTIPLSSFGEPCNSPVLEKRAGDGWVPVHDDRPLIPPNRRDYYLDGRLIEFNRTDYGCDGGQLCGPYPRDGRVIVGKPLEYVKTAMKDQLDAIESRPLTGLARVTLYYYYDATCGFHTPAPRREQVSSSVEFDVADLEQLGEDLDVADAGT